MDGKTTQTISDVRLLNEDIHPLKQLGGFQKHHRIPTSISNGDRQFLAEIARAELDDDLQEKFDALRSAFGFKRKEISVSGPTDGGGMIATPFFNYEITVGFVSDDPSKVVWRRSISDIRDASQIFTAEFTKIFENQFSILEVAPANELDLEAIVDHIEDADSDSVSVNYDKDVTWCEIKVASSGATVKLDGESVRVISRHEVPPQELLNAFVSVQQEFLATLNCSNSPFLMGAK